MWKREANINWSMVTCQGSTRYWNYLVEVYWPCAGIIPAVNAIGTQLRDPDEFGIDPMACGGSNKYIDAAAEIGKNPSSKHQIQPECGDKQADAGRDCRTCLARPSSQARTGTTRKK